MEIRQAKTEDRAAVIAIYGEARTFMAEAGNPTQWGRTYPPDEIIDGDLAAGHLYLCCEGGAPLGVFCYFEGVESAYDGLTDGAWLNDLPYGVIHRIAVAACGRGCGVARCCFDYAYARCGNLKIDTHRDNLPMQRALAKAGFRYCGVVHYPERGGERLAYQRWDG